ncbi:selenide, water dikinase [Pseudodesulfovibrio sediminis]|uniref:Selenide, water dikinase n=1 Tax=Pseudodesulfovibrio sediminis TaxID=2810563 RepID=A0ABN6EUN5_9BACT|nr:selenide, water dikinase [Pseudodesulfovibrio sediminis]
MLTGGPGDNEDAAIVSFPAGKALVQTLDFFTPIVNDPYKFGRIGAANALSDVYAMGGEPWTAMNIVCFPAKSLPMEVLSEILRGAGDTVAEAGAIPAGGHSVEDDELKFGLSVSGIVDPDRFASNRGVQPGDELVLTKPIGTGVLATAVKGEMPGHEAMETLLAAVCGRLNKTGGDIIREFGLKGATDITGFGLGGHMLELAHASDVVMELRMQSVPLLEGALDLASMGMLPAGSICNRNYYRPRVNEAPGLDPIHFDLMFDAQTSGGLILAVPKAQLVQVMDRLETAGDMAAHIGTAHAHEPGTPRLSIV